MSSFSEALQRYLGSLNDRRQRGASEDTIRDAFLGFLRHAFPRLEQTDPILLEKHIPALRVRGGFADALYGDLIFEFKKRLDDQSRADGREELERYIKNQRQSELYLGILTDGETLEVYALRQDQLAKVDDLRLVNDPADEAKLWLDCYLFHEKELAPTANDVALRFGERSPTFWHSVRILEDLWRQIGGNPATQTKFIEWQSLLSIVYGSPIGDEDLFLRHTYLALFARVLAYVVLEHHAPSPAELPGIVTGSTFERMGFENFVNEDFFTWVSDAAVFDRACEMIRALATRLTAAYNLSAIHEDLLKELYQRLVDPQTRHDLGEFYTPDWLAELTLRKAGYPPAGFTTSDQISLLDPSCGSGTLLFTAVRLLREAGKKGKALVATCAECLAGIDVHPLAVTISKTNLLLALGPELRGYQDTFRLPIFMADSLSSATPNLQENVVPVHVDIATIADRANKTKPRNLPASFELPAQLAANPELLHQALDALLHFSSPTVSDAAAMEGFGNRLETVRIPDSHGHLWRSNLRLMRWLMQSPATNGVWRFILKNAYQPELFAQRKFTFVVGNPPWLMYRSIQRPDYQERVRKLVFRYGLLDRRHSHLFANIELGTLFFAFCADRYLARQGTLAFVMPRSILTGSKQHAEFQRQYVLSCRLLIDCQRVTELFNIPCCVAIRDNSSGDQPLAEPPANQSVPMMVLQAELPSRNASLAEAQSVWQESETTFTLFTTGPHSLYRPKIIKGATLLPRCLWFVQSPPNARAVNQRQPQLETDLSIEKQAKKPWKGRSVSGSVEAGFLFTTLLSDHMVPCGWRKLSLVALPLLQDENGRSHLLNIDEANRSGRAGLADWLTKAERLWAKHKKGSSRVKTVYDRLNFNQGLTCQHPSGVAKLVYNKSGTHICACVVNVTDVSEWSVNHLPVSGFLADQVTYYFETKSPDEAHYLCAILNAPSVDRAIKRYQPKGQFGAQHGGGERDVTRLPFEVLPILKFVRNNVQHRALTRLSKKCHEKVSRFFASAGPAFLSTPIGRLRTLVRKDTIAAELAEIDALIPSVIAMPAES